MRIPVIILRSEAVRSKDFVLSEGVLRLSAELPSIPHLLLHFLLPLVCPYWQTTELMYVDNVRSPRLPLPQSYFILTCTFSSQPATRKEA